MPSDQISFTDVEYAKRRRVSRREQFLDTMDATIPWSRWVGLIEPIEPIEPFYYSGSRGRKPKALETMLRMYLLQAWFSLSDEGVEDAACDSYAMRRFLGLNFTVEQVPDAAALPEPAREASAGQEAAGVPGGDLRGAGLDHARRQHRRHDDHRRSVAGEERIRRARS